VTLRDLFILTRMEPWKDFDRDAIWSARLRGDPISGHTNSAVVGGEKVPRLRIANSIGLGAINAIVGGVLAKTKNPTGRQVAETAKTKLIADSRELLKIPLAGGMVQARSNIKVAKIAENIPHAVETLGKALKVRTLTDALEIKRMNPAWPVAFNVNRTLSTSYEVTFKEELDQQLQNQQAGLNRLSVEEWVARVDTYKAQLT